MSVCLIFMRKGHSHLNYHIYYIIECTGKQKKTRLSSILRGLLTQWLRHLVPSLLLSSSHHHPEEVHHLLVIVHVLALPEVLVAVTGGRQVVLVLTHL